MMQQRALFRAKALEHYLRGQDKPVFPRFIAPPIRFALWCIMALFVATGAVIWWGQVPVYSTGIGLVDSCTAAQGSSSCVVLFLPAGQRTQFRPGESVTLQSASDGQQWQQNIVRVAPQTMGPFAAERLFGLAAPAALPVSNSAVALVQLDRQTATEIAPGSLVSVRVTIGSRRLISLIPLLNQLIGG